MKRKVIIKPLAVKNLAHAYDWYEGYKAGLGEEFLDEWESVALHLSEYGESYSKKYKDFRDALLRRFPYVVVYEIDGDSIVIYNLINTKRSLKKRYKKR